MEHLGSPAVEHGEADIGAVLCQVIVDPERTSAEGGVHHLKDRIGDAGGVRTVRDDAAKASCTCSPKP